MTGDELEALKDLPVPEPREGPRAAALAAALAAFDAAAKKADSPAQENASSGRLTLASTQTQRRRLMRANFFNYKIAASIAALVVAVPAALYMLRQERPPAVPQDMVRLEKEKEETKRREMALLDEPARLRQEMPRATPQQPDARPAVSGESLPAEAEKTATPSRENKTTPVIRADAKPAKETSAQPGGKLFPNGEKSIYDALRPDRATQTASAAPASAPPAAPAPVSSAAARRAREAERLYAAAPSSGAVRAVLQSSDRINSPAINPFAEAAGGKRADSRATGGSISSEWLSGQPMEENRDQFEAFASNSVKQVAAEPVSTFSIDVDTASYSFVRRSLLAGRMPPKDAVRVEEMINYFPYAYPRAESAGLPFQAAITVTPSPWKPTNKLVHIGIKGYEIAEKERPRANLVLLIDVSGSMAPQDRLPLLKNAFRMLLGELKPDDTVGIVTYASQSGVALEPTRVAERGKILDALNQLNAGGSTSGGQGLQDAYRLAEMNFDKNAVNRIILATDGDFNVGITDREELKRFIEAKRQTGIYLSVIGVGQDNYNDRLMQALAQNGNGVAAYVDTLNEARKVLVDEASSSLFPIAQDVKIQIEFNPARVSEYRLIGYETRALKREDFNNDKVDAGDIGSGHTVTAIYEITPVGAPKFVDDLRYQKPEAQPAPPSGTPGELGFLKIRYKLPGEETSKLITTPIAADLERADVQAVPEDVRFSIAVAAFGQLLRGEPYLGAFSFDDVIALAQTARGADPFGYRAEFLNLVRLAKPARR
jgi:Ca-activated chloride channel homolog